MKITSVENVFKNEIFRQAIELLEISVCITDKSGNILYVNPYFEKQTGYTSEEVLKKNPGMLHSVDIRQSLGELQANNVEESTVWSGEVRIRRKDGSTLWVNTNISPVRDEKGEIAHFVMIENDITEQKKLLNNARQRENLLNDIALLSKTGGFQYDIDTGTFYWTKELFALHGANPGHETDHLNLMLSCTHPDHRRQLEKAFGDLFKNGSPFDIKVRFRDLHGVLKWVRIYARAIEDDSSTVNRVLGVMMDITSEINTKESLKRAYQERGLLMSEIHHRVKNNLGLISGLLQLQKMSSSYDDISDLDKSIQRVNSVALLYEQLYHSENFNDISINENISKQLKIVSQAFDPGGLIRIEHHLENVKLNINQAQPLGLLLNEILTNSFRHAFTEQRTGILTVRLHQKNDRIILYLADNGKGMDTRLIEDEPATLGLQLIRNLMIQLEAGYTVNGHDGLAYHIEFKTDQKKGAAVYTSDFDFQVNDSDFEYDIDPD